MTTPRLDSDCNSEFGASPDTGTPPGLQGIAPSPFAGNSLEVCVTLMNCFLIKAKVHCSRLSMADLQHALSYAFV